MKAFADWFVALADSICVKGCEDWENGFVACVECSEHNHCANEGTLT